MKTNIRQWALSLVLSLVALSGVVSAATHTVVTAPSPLAGKVSRELRTHLLYYSLFDRLSFRVDGSKVTLLGKVSWPSLKPTAERLVANIEGVTSVENQIEVLPTSFHDDRIRLATTRALFSNGFLSKYAWFGSHGHLHGRFYGHPYASIPYESDIHIIVKNGHVTLEGVVHSKTDSDAAFILTNGVSGADSGASRSAFRDDADHDSGMKPISVPTRCRSVIGRFRNRDRDVGIGLRSPPATP